MADLNSDARNSRDSSVSVWAKDPDPLDWSDLYAGNIPENDYSSSDTSYGHGWDKEKYLKVIRASKEGYPKTYGGVLKTSQETKFVSRSPPDITKTTRILAVVGCHAGDGKDSPDIDGWFLSDFFLFMALFRGLTPDQTWIMADTCAPQNLINRWSERFPPGYVHGDPHFTRKIVLSQKMIDENELAKITLVPEANVKTAFKSILEHECETASRNRQRLLVIVLGHGDQDTYGIQLGRKNQGNHNLYPLFKREELDDIAAEHNPDLTMISNACYSGGWAIYPSRRFSAITAAGEGEVSESWARSTSYSRVCGSIWASAVVKTLTSRNSPLLEYEMKEPPQALLDSKLVNSSYAALTRQIHTTLFTEVDKWAFVHNIRFSAQDDDWNANGLNRSGFPVADYKKQYDSLEDYKPHKDEERQTYNRRHPTSIERGEMSDEELLAIINDSSGTSFIERAKRAFGGSNKSLLSKVRSEAKLYLASHPGRDSLTTNIAAHGKLYKLLETPDPTARDIQDCLNIVEYRTKKLATAERLLSAVGIPRLKRGNDPVPGASFNSDAFQAHATRTEELKHRWYGILRMVFEAKIFDEPLEDEQFYPWDKPERYMAASFYVVADVTPATLSTMLATMVKIMEGDIEHSLRKSMRSREVRTAARQFFQVLGEQVRSLSPRKRTQSQAPRSPSTPTLTRPEPGSSQDMSLSSDIDPRGHRRGLTQTSQGESSTPSRLRRMISKMTLTDRKD